MKFPVLLGLLFFFVMPGYTIDYEENLPLDVEHHFALEHSARISAHRVFENGKTEIFITENHTEKRTPEDLLLYFPVQGCFKRGVKYRLEFTIRSNAVAKVFAGVQADRAHADFLTSETLELDKGVAQFVKMDWAVKNEKDVYRVPVFLLGNASAGTRIQIYHFRFFEYR